MSTPHDHPHDERHEDLLHAHLAGDVPGHDAALRARLERCPACAARLEELRSLTTLLEQVGGAQRSSLERAPGRPAPGADRVAATLQALAAGQPPAALPVPVPVAVRRATLWRVGLAAASVVAAGWVVKTLLPPAQDSRGDVTLGDGQDRSATPNGTVSAFARFDWPGAPQDAVHYRLRVWCMEPSAPGTLVVDEKVERLPWTPTADQLESMRSAIEWELIPIDAMGVPGVAVRRAARIQP